MGDIENPTRVAIEGPFPANKIPVTGIGHNEKGELITVLINGRQKASTGGSLLELSNIMIEKGIVNGGIGAAGGDTAAILRTYEKFNVLNSPSNPDGKTRLAPNLLAIEGSDPSAPYLF